MMIRTAAPIAVMLALIGGIVASALLLWAPHFSENRQIPEPPVSFWEIPDADDFTTTTNEASISVHNVIASPSHITVVYSIEATGEETTGQQSSLTTKATLEGSDGTTLSATDAERLASIEDLTLGTVIFESYKLGAEEINLKIPELETQVAGTPQKTTLDNPVEMHVITRLRPNESTNKIVKLKGVAETDSRTIRKGPYGAFLVLQPQMVVWGVGRS